YPDKAHPGWQTRRIRRKARRGIRRWQGRNRRGRGERPVPDRRRPASRVRDRLRTLELSWNRMHSGTAPHPAQRPPSMPDERQILGINFYVGDVEGVFQRLAHGGLLVVPAAPALKDVADNPEYRDALMNADVAIADSAFMVLVWNWLQRDSIP